MQNFKNVILIVVNVIFAVFLALLLMKDREEEAERAREYKELSAQIQKDTREKMEVGEEIYDELLLALTDSFSGIVCWGDRSMVGNRSVNLPDELSELVDRSVFESIRERFSDKAELDNVHDLKIDVVNMGAANEGFREILARTGARQMVLGEALEIPAGDDRQNITLADPDRNLLLFAEQQYARFGETTIKGIKGRLYSGTGSYDELHGRLSFGRDEGGVAVTAPAGTPVYTEGAEKYRSYTPVLFFEESDDLEAAEFVDGIKDILSIYGDGKYVLICTTAAGSKWDKKLKRAFPDQYLRNDSPVEDMSTEDCEDLAGEVFECLEKQGAFDAVYQAVEAAKSSLDERLGASE